MRKDCFYYFVCNHTDGWCAFCDDFKAVGADLKFSGQFDKDGNKLDGTLNEPLRR